MHFPRRCKRIPLSHIPRLSPLTCQYLYIQHSNLYLLALTKRNSNAVEIILFLHTIVQVPPSACLPNFLHTVDTDVKVMIEYFKELEEESIRDNFVVIYELLDEMMDFGYPQTTETKSYKNTSHKNRTNSKSKPVPQSPLPMLSPGVPRASCTAKTKSFSTSSSLSISLVNSNGNVLRSEILGAVKMKCYLSGMPELRLGLNDKIMFEASGRNSRGKSIEMEDVKFHQCVRLSRFENDRTISFIPPDGEFELMSYRLNSQVFRPNVWFLLKCRLNL